MAQEYSRAIARTVVGQLAELASYEAVQDSAAEILAELLLKYITELSASAHGYAELANRTAINVHDVLLGLDDLGTSVPELQTYLSSLSPDDNMFAHPLPQYPVVKPGRSVPSFAEKGEQPPPHIPSFLPAFPDKHTYVHTPQYQGHERQPEKQAQIIQRGRREAEKALLNLHTSLLQAVPGIKAEPSDLTVAAATNPYTAPPEVQVVPAQVGAGLQGPTGMDVDTHQGQGGQQQLAVAGDGSGGGEGVLQRSAYQREAALRAFSAVLPKPKAEGQQGGEGGGGGVVIEPGDLYSAEELELSWRSVSHLDNKGALRQPLGPSGDFAANTYAAAVACASGRPQEDAYKAAAEAAAAAFGGGGAGGHQRKRKSQYGTVPGAGDPVKRRAEEILEKSANLADAEAEAEGQKG